MNFEKEDVLKQILINGRCSHSSIHCTQYCPFCIHPPESDRIHPCSLVKKYGVNYTTDLSKQNIQQELNLLKLEKLREILS